MNTRRKKYIKDRNILRNNVASIYSYGVQVGTFQAHCILSRYYKALSIYKSNIK